MLAFMQITDAGGNIIAGEATAVSYENWCVVESLAYEGSSPDDRHERSSDEDWFQVTIEKPVDSSSHRIIQCAIMDAGSQSFHFQKVIVEVCGVNEKPADGKSAGVAKLRTIVQITMQEVSVKSWSMDGETTWEAGGEANDKAGSNPKESLTLQFSEISFDYRDLVHDQGKVKNLGSRFFEAKANDLSARAWK